MIYKFFLLQGILLLCFFSTFSQDIDKLINPGEAERIEKILSADDMQGRKIFSPGIDKAANFIADEFNNNGLAFLNGLHSYKQTFSLIKTRFIGATGSFDG